MKKKGKSGFSFVGDAQQLTLRETAEVAAPGSLGGSGELAAAYHAGESTMQWRCA